MHVYAIKSRKDNLSQGLIEFHEKNNSAKIYFSELLLEFVKILRRWLNKLRSESHSSILKLEISLHYFKRNVLFVHKKSKYIKNILERNRRKILGDCEC